MSIKDNVRNDLGNIFEIFLHKVEVSIFKKSAVLFEAWLPHDCFVTRRFSVLLPRGAHITVRVISSTKDEGQTCVRIVYYAPHIL